MGWLRDTINTTYDSLTFNNTIEVLRKAENAVNKASESAQSAVTYLRNHPTAGGDLASGNGTVLSTVSASATKIGNQYKNLADARKKFELAKTIFDGVGLLFDIITGGQYSLFKGAIETGLGGLSGLIDAAANGDVDGALESAFNVGGSVGAFATGNFGVANAGNMWHAYANGDQVMTEHSDSIIDSYRRGEISGTEATTSVVFGSVGTAVVSTVDCALNFVGIDLPDSWTAAVYDGAATVGKYFGTGLDWGVDVVSSLWR